MNKWPQAFLNESYGVGLLLRAFIFTFNEMTAGFATMLFLFKVSKFFGLVGISVSFPNLIWLDVDEGI